MNQNNFLAGLGGAIVLTLLHESLKHVNEDMPRIDLVGEEAVLKATNLIGVEIDNPETLYQTTLMADILSNAAYYSMISGEGKALWGNAISVGLLAGVGAIKLPEAFGLDDEPVTKTSKTKFLTVGYYLIGALAAAALFQTLESTKNK